MISARSWPKQPAGAPTGPTTDALVELRTDVNSNPSLE
jgi:hypothetical protein